LVSARLETDFDIGLAVCCGDGASLPEWGVSAAFSPKFNYKCAKYSLMVPLHLLGLGRDELGDARYSRLTDPPTLESNSRLCYIRY
jgi:hypothetical protein